EALEAIKRSSKSEIPAKTRVLRGGIVDEELETIIRAVEPEAELVVRPLVAFDNRLIIVVDGRRSDVRARLLEDGLEPGVNPTPSSSEGEAPVLGSQNRSLDECASVDQIRLQHPMITALAISGGAVIPVTFRVRLPEARVHD